MSGDFKIHIRHEGHEYQIDLASTSPDKAEVTLSGIGYSVKASPQSAKIRQLFLEQATLPTSTTIEGLLNNVRHLASVEDVSITSAKKTHEVGLSHLGAGGAIMAITSAEISLAHRIDEHCKSLEKAGFTGAVLVEKEGRVLLAEAYGATGVTAATPFYIGSLTKQFTAAAIMQLVEQKKIKLDESINRYLPPELQSEKWEKVTVHHLLSHTSGIHNFTEQTDYHAEAHGMTLDSMLDKEKARELDFPSGTKFHYSNTGYNLLGKIIAHVSGHSYEEYVETNLLQPAGMTSSQLHPEGRQVTSEYACQGHRVNADGSLIVLQEPSFHMTYAAGGMISTVTDLATWNHMLRGERPDILSQESIALMTTPNLNDYGYGLFKGIEHGREVVNHDGSVSGFGTWFSQFPKENVFITVLCNTEDFSPGYVHNHLERMTLDGVGSFPEPIDTTAADFLPYEGTFTSTKSPTSQPYTFALGASGLPQLVRVEEGKPSGFLPTYPLSNGRLLVPSEGLEMELTEKGTLIVYQEDQVIDELVKL